MWHSELITPGPLLSSPQALPKPADEKLFSKEKSSELLKSITQSEGATTIQIPKCEKVTPCGPNYIDVKQGSSDWLSTRRGVPYTFYLLVPK